jgi:YD repeat-containing protein
MKDAAAYDHTQIADSRVIPWSAVTPDSGELAHADTVVFEAHGVPGQTLLGSADGPLSANLVGGTAIGKAMMAAGFKGGPARTVVVPSCNSATSPSASLPGGGTAQAIADATGSPTWGAEPIPAHRAEARAEIADAHGAVPGMVLQAPSGAAVDVIHGQWSEYVPKGGGTPVDHAAGKDYVRVERRAKIPCRACGTKGKDPKKKPDTDGTATAGHPIDVITGALFTPPCVDFTLPGLFAVPWVRTYSTASASTTRGLGFGWTHQHHWTAEGRGDGRFVVTSPEGEELDVSLPADGATASLLYGRRIGRRIAPEGDELSVLIGDRLWRVLRACPDGVWRLAELVDASGNVARFGWTGDELTSLVDTAGRRADLVHRGEQLHWLARAPDPGEGGTGRVRLRTLAVYELDGAGDLVSATDAHGRTTRYSYDQHHYLLTEERADGLSFHFRYEDDGDVIRCVETWGELAATDILEELGAPPGEPARPAGIFHARLQYGPEPFTTIATDAAGGKHRYVGNALGLVTTYVDPRGVVQMYDYDANGVLVSTTDGLGRKSERSYDARGRLISQTEPGNRVTEYAYDEAGLLSAVFEPGGGAWRREVDDRGRLVALTDPGGAVVRFERDARGQLIRVTWPDGGADTISYDAAGNRIRHARAGLGTWHYDYDALGDLLALTDPRGAKTTFTYDGLGNHVATTRGHLRTEYELDALKRRVVTRFAGGARSRRRYVADALVELTFGGDELGA